MKASIKFRDEQKPLIRAKVPLSILGFPFQSGIVAGDTKELSLNLSTFFDSGPSLKFAYRPNDSFNPFTLVFKSGIGHFGSPISSSITMSAEFNFVGKQNPRFLVHFKPQIGDFTLKKSQSSDFVSKLKVNGAVSDDDKVVESPTVVKNGYFGSNDEKFSVLPASFDAGVVKGYLSGTEVTARTSVPVRSYAAMNFRWGVRLPPVDDVDAKTLLMKTERTAEISLKRFPVLVMNKIGIEHVAVVKDKKECDQVEQGSGDVAAACLDVRRQLEAIQVENGKLRRAMEDLSSEIVKERKEIKFSSRADRKSPEFNDFEINNKA
ncbi:POU domain, class 2, transcription factor 2 like [Heracleum sosnowskyi]|uniref:POU domain, class 2, transcription factor 2 like n=1 Tax=Heracleum sosnowskyi TaxID=360622 RepID=A0AAD8HHW0_9APIA|nr:POU domain, class 2, transcription factor 2 like [Heracleum sosnowskyi]